MTESRPEPVFNAIHDIFDNNRSFHIIAERLIVNAKIDRGQRVLDVACGTGWATMAVARAVGDTGRVIGVDIATKMLDVAKRKTVSAGLLNVEYRLGDAEALNFGDASFEAVICASSIFFLKNILKALHEWRRVLKLGGTIAFSSFGTSYAQPFHKLFFERLAKYDGQSLSAQQAGERTDTPEKCRELLERAGFEKIETNTEQLGYHIQDANAYWQEMTSTIINLRLNRLNPIKLEKFKAEHLFEVESLRTEQGIWLNMPVIFSVAKKSS
jgi:ubiquinone/menaquinone biosynthesis C-methylase UbiE